mmetsp:Transcript_32513/g.58207  ORF Transcript_32513/g.58207 Transcript_32513/m.58207 type:complete len:478 (-) Transcript_32513:172-1605(-)
MVSKMLAAVALLLLAATPMGVSAEGCHEGRYHDLVSLESARLAPLEAFTTWATHHAKEYLQDAVEFARRFEIFKDNMAYVVEYNAQHPSHWLHLNAFADLSISEYRQHYLGLSVTEESLAARAERSSNSEFVHADVEAAGSVDWRSSGAVSEVKNQGQCGSCWAFSTTGSIEGANQIMTGKMISLSEQELVDCDPSDNGCQGGLMDNAFQYIIRNGGLDTESDYPYHATAGSCNGAKKNRHIVSIDSFQDVPANSEGALMKAVTKQPVSVAIQANERAFQLYGGGVLDAPCGTQLDHGVLAVGYDSGEGYWIVKNSWGDWWGEKGYIRLAFGKNGGAGQCGICTMASFPIKTNPNPPPAPPGPPPSPTPEPPGPKNCDQMGTFQCEQDQTCCCEFEISGYCLMYACCPYPEATCCDDHKSCCPSDHPICDTDAGQCKAAGDALDWVEMGRKQAPVKKPEFLNRTSRKQGTIQDVIMA